jgi:gas vesicle protein
MVNYRGSKLQPTVNYILAVTAVALAFTVLAGWYASSRPASALDKDKLEKITEDLHSYASESYIIADQYKQHRTTDNFTEISATRLHYAVSKISDQLDEQQVEPSAKHQLNEASEYANDLEKALSDLIRLPSDNQSGQIVNQIQDVKKETE